MVRQTASWTTSPWSPTLRCLNLHLNRSVIPSPTITTGRQWHVVNPALHGNRLIQIYPMFWQSFKGEHSALGSVGILCTSKDWLKGVWVNPVRLVFTHKPGFCSFPRILWNFKQPLNMPYEVLQDGRIYRYGDLVFSWQHDGKSVFKISTDGPLLE